MCVCLRGRNWSPQIPWGFPRLPSLGGKTPVQRLPLAATAPHSACMHSAVLGLMVLNVFEMNCLHLKLGVFHSKLQIFSFSRNTLRSDYLRVLRSSADL